jgi:hypothetical protein
MATTKTQSAGGGRGFVNPPLVNTSTEPVISPQATTINADEAMAQAVADAQSTVEERSPTEQDVLDSIATGPLADLYNNRFGSKTFVYPRDVDDLSKGHAVQFEIKNIIPANLNKLTDPLVSGFNSATSVLKNAAGKAPNDIVGAAKDIATSIEDSVTSGVKVLTDAYSSGSASDAVSASIEVAGQMLRGEFNYEPERTSDPVATIRLYMPDTLNFSYNAQYDKLSLAEAINSALLVGKISTAIFSTLNNNAAKLATKKLGYTFNPQQQMLFEGIDFREFEMQFIFTPTSSDEAETIKQIIKQLRIAAAPTRNSGVGGFFFTPPSVFDVKFLFNGEVNTSIAPVRPCVLQSVSVDYAPNGWAAMRDGAPVQTTVSLSFKEIELIDRNSISKEL